MPPSELPSFLSPSTTTDSNSGPFSCTFQHSSPLGSSLVHWWSPKYPSARPKTVLLFIPGNPGLIGFYTPFLSHIYDASSTDDSLAILAHTHVGYESSDGNGRPRDKDHVGLTAQVAALVEVVDAIADSLGPEVEIVLAGHSMGSWLATQLLKARPERIASLFLLFPSIYNIADTPNGVALSVPTFLPVCASTDQYIDFIVAISPAVACRRRQPRASRPFHPSRRFQASLPNSPTRSARRSEIVGCLPMRYLHVAHTRA